MTPDALRPIVLEALVKVAPEVDPARVATDANLRETFDLDSMDVLNFVVALHDRLGVDIPERDYGRLATVGDAVEYLASRTPAAT